jgi:hypothetical protein
VKKMAKNDEVKNIDEEKKIATIRDNKDKKLFRCKNCSDSDGEVYVSWNDAIKVDPNRDRTLLLCPYCKEQFGVFSLDNPIDINFEPKNLKNVK